MGLFGPSSEQHYTELVEAATNENAEENWQLIITVCDKAGKSSDDAKNYLRTIIKRLHNNDPHIALKAATLLDSCIKNSGKLFHVEVASREFETEFTKLMSKAHPKVARNLRESLKKWADNEFKTDPQLNLIPSLYSKLKSSGLDFSSSDMPTKKTAPVSKDPNVVESQEEEEQIMKAIELSLKESSGSSPAKAPQGSSSLYPSTSSLVSSSQSTTGTSSANPAPNSSSGATSTTPAKEPKKVRALYDFEAAEDNELTFTTGEILLVLDDSDPNWWKGSNQRGEGLFPSSFVTTDLNVQPEKFLYEKAKKIVQFKESVDVKVLESSSSSSKEETEPEVEINELKIDRLLHLLHEADPTNSDTDTEEMLKLEREGNTMGPLIDSELERVDRKHAQLTQLSADLVEALGLYHTLMREPQFSPPPPLGKMPNPYGYGGPPMPPQAMTYNGGSMPQPRGGFCGTPIPVPYPMAGGATMASHMQQQQHHGFPPGVMFPQGMPQGLPPPPHLMHPNPDDMRFDHPNMSLPPGMHLNQPPYMHPGMLPQNYPPSSLPMGANQTSNGPPQQQQHFSQK